MTLWWEFVTFHEVCELYVLCACSCLGPMVMRGKFLWKWLRFNCGYVSCLYVPFYLVGDACAEIVAILLVYVSILACCSVLCIFERHMLAFVDLIHALPTRGRKVPNSCFQGEFCIKGREIKFGKNAFVQGDCTFMHLGALFRLNSSCALLLMVSSPFWGPGASRWLVDDRSSVISDWQRVLDWLLA
jgi:hypothetical protein